MTLFTDTIIIGGGQAGLSISWYLKQAGREHLVLDRGKVGDTWRNRWDSFCLVTPNRFCQLPGFPYTGDAPNGFMLRDEIVDYVEQYAKSFEPPIQGNVEVSRIRSANGGDGFTIETSEGVYTTNNLFIAVGTHQHPNIPVWATKLPSDIMQIHTSNYRNPAQLPLGATLVVGSGQSGCQVVEDLTAVGRDVHLCVGNAGRIPRRYRGKDFLEWENLSGSYDLPVDELPIGRDIRFKPHPHLSGRDGGRTIDLRNLGQQGVKLHGRLLDVDGKLIHFSDDLHSKLDAADKFCNDNLADVDEYITKNNINAPDNDIVPIKWKPSVAAPIFDIKKEGVTSVIFGTGFHFDFSWIDLPVFDMRGYPKYDRGVTNIPGLYFVGLHWLHTQGSGLFYKVSRDAEFAVNHLCNREA